MVYNVVVKEEALADTLEAYFYYEEQQIGLGDRFLEALTYRYSQLSENPRYFSFVHTDKEKTLRDVKLKDFPYLVIFDIVETEVIVYSVHNASKNRG